MHGMTQDDVGVAFARTGDFDIVLLPCRMKGDSLCKQND